MENSGNTDGKSAEASPAAGTQGPTRRTALKLGLGGTLLVSIGGGLLGWRWFARGYSRYLAPGEQPIALSVKQFAIVKALVTALLPGENGFPSGTALAIPQRIDEELWAAAPELSSDVKAGLHLIEHSTLLHGFAHRFTALDIAARQRYLTMLLTGKSAVMLQLAMAYKQLTHLLYYGHPDVWKQIGYDGPYVQKAVPPDSSVAYQALLRKVGGV